MLCRSSVSSMYYSHLLNTVHLNRLASGVWRISCSQNSQKNGWTSVIIVNGTAFELWQSRENKFLEQFPKRVDEGMNRCCRAFWFIEEANGFHSLRNKNDCQLYSRCLGLGIVPFSRVVMFTVYLFLSFYRSNALLSCFLCIRVAILFFF